MQLNISKEWLLKTADRDEGLIGVGGLAGRVFGFCSKCREYLDDNLFEHQNQCTKGPTEEEAEVWAEESQRIFDMPEGDEKDVAYIRRDMKTRDEWDLDDYQEFYDLDVNRLLAIADKYFALLKEKNDNQRI